MAIAISAAITAGLAFVQSRMTQHQINSSMRPWVGSTEHGFTLSSHGVITAMVKNFGTLPAQKVRMWHGAQLEPFTVRQLLELPRRETKDEAVIMPSAEKSVTLLLPEYDRVVRERLKVGLALIVEYEYANNKQATYHLAGQFNPSTREQGIDYEFTT